MNFEKYLGQNEDLTKFRLSDQELNIETGRHGNIPRNETLLPFCKPDIVEDEYHVLLVCGKYSDLRNTTKLTI